MEKEVQKAMGTMGEVDTEIARKKEASKQVKALRAQIHSHETEAAQLTAQQQHLQRQRASLSERLQRLEHQVSPHVQCGSAARRSLIELWGGCLRPGTSSHITV